MKTDKTQHVKSISAFQKNAWFVFGLFWIIALFQLTALKDIWSIQEASRLINFSVLFILNIYVLRSLGFHSFHQNLWIYYLLPGVLVYLGLLINIGRNVVTNPDSVGYFGFLIPWAAYLVVPSLMKSSKIKQELIWRYFYYFMLVSVVLGLIEHVLFFKYGWLSARILDTKNGVFLGCRFSLFHRLADGTPYYRFYANFNEPGTLAMWILPALAYACLAKKYLGVAVLSLGLLFADSLGGVISLFILTNLILYVKLADKIKNKNITLGITIMFSLLIGIFLSDSLRDSYENKAESRSTRIENLYNVTHKMGSLMMSNPLGIDLALETKDIHDEDYIGSNFMPAVYFQNGGDLALLGYVWIVLFSLKIALKNIKFRRDLSLEEKVVFISLICLFPFIIQRTTIYENAMYALLFSPVIICSLQKKDK
jgi:hypothetical protein